MKNYLTLEQAQMKGLDWNEYQTIRMNEQIKDLKNFEGVCNLVPLVYYSEYEGVKRFEHITVFIEYKGVLLRTYKKYNESSFIFFLAESVRLQNFDHNLVQPNKVGKATTKKLDEWITYLQQIEALKTAKIKEQQNKETEFLNKIKNSGLKVSHQSNDDKRGYIETENFDFSFEIQSDGYIKQKITLRCGNTIDDFLKLVR